MDVPEVSCNGGPRVQGSTLSGLPAELKELYRLACLDNKSPDSSSLRLAYEDPEAGHAKNITIIVSGHKIAYATRQGKDREGLDTYKLFANNGRQIGYLRTAGKPTEIELSSMSHKPLIWLAKPKGYEPPVAPSPEPAPSTRPTHGMEAARPERAVILPIPAPE